MSCATYYTGDTYIHRLDPRPKVVATLAFSVLAALTSHPGVLVAGLILGAFLVSLARISSDALLKRLLRLNIFMLLLFILVPLTFPGEPLFMVGTLLYSYEGLMWSVIVTLKANAIVLVFAALMGTVDPFVLGHAFHHLKVPEKLTHLFMFTLRYIDVLHHEYMALIRAMKTRGFIPSMRIHTYRSYAYLTGMLIVRSLERSERVMEAMKCRGYDGEFHVVSHFHFEKRDAIFLLITSAVLVILSVAIYTNRGRLW
ncbi:MAG: cobalt ECF transporter T component CbiQ [Candidatus Krumholzibacteria bacterium]|nr:cobalt ECF transporter T component CbiQ [Candidatus Krumholzibacteria bacterium]